MSIIVSRFVYRARLKREREAEISGGLAG
jgi:hypothetical protein